MQGYQLSGEEEAAKRGLSLLAKDVYGCFRQKMDYATGIAGGKRGINIISYSLLAEHTEFIPDPGSTKRRCRPTKEQLRSAIAELERAGLMKDAGSNKKDGLIKKLILAKTDQSVQNRNPTGTPQEPHRGTPRQEVDTFSNSNNAVANNHIGGNPTGTPQHSSSKNPTHPVSDIRSNSVAAAVPDTARAREDLTQVLRELFPDQHRQIENNSKAQAMLDDWCAAGVCAHHIRKSHREICNRPGVESFGPVYLRGLVLELTAADGLQEKRQRNSDREEQDDRAMCQSVEQWAKERGLGWDPQNGEAYSTWLERMRLQRLDERKRAAHD